MTSENGTRMAEECRSSDIAIIGMAGRFPEADSIDELFVNLCQARDSVRKLSPERKSRTSLLMDDAYQVSGFIEEIDTFDYTFFRLSRGEAQNMAPEQRLLLQAAYHALENAGIDPMRLDGARVSVYAGDTRLEYSRLTNAHEPTALVGSHVSTSVGRMSRFFGFCGPSAMVDSSCSSSLLAVKYAVNDLRLGEACLALACGVNLDLFPDRKGDGDDIGIKSADGKTRCFSAEASGTGSGEAVVCVVLKKLEDAVRDGDLIHAIIKGIAANHVGRRASSLTAPDSTAQAEVIRRAWHDAGIDPTTISYIEAHGTGTRLGDPIEIEALDAAFSHVTSRKHFCALSSVKSNFGHTWSAAGIVGLVKAALALKRRVLFPNLHCERLSPLINFSDSSVVVTRELTAWQPPCGIRRAGVSSFGIMGTNVHAVLEEAPPRDDVSQGDSRRETSFWFPVSAASIGALEANVAELGRWVESHPDIPLADVQRTLVSGRGHFHYRACVAAANMRDLQSTLRALDLRSGHHGCDRSGTVAVLIVPEECEISLAVKQALRRAHPSFDRMYSQCERAAESAGPVEAADTHGIDQFAFQYAFCGLLREIGVDTRHLVGDGAGRLVLDALDGRLALQDAVRRFRPKPGYETAELRARVERLLERLDGYARLLFIEAGCSSRLSSELASRVRRVDRVVSLTDGADCYVALLRDLYTGGANWRWDVTAGDGRRVELPAYQFQRIRCWKTAATVPTSASRQVDQRCRAVPDHGIECIGRVIEVWKDVLAEDQVSADASFFDLGGDSISGMQVIHRLQRLFGVELEHTAIVMHPTPRELARHISAIRGAAGPSPRRGRRSERGYVATSAAQRNIWLAAQFEGGHSAFTLSRSFRLDGAFDCHALRSALDELARRHDALRSTFSFVGGRLLQRIRSRRGFNVPLQCDHVEAHLCTDERLIEKLRTFMALPFDFENGPLLRAQLLTIGDERHVLTYCTHHIVADGWSLELLTRDLAALYTRHAKGGAFALPRIRGGSYRHCQRNAASRSIARRKADAKYWLTRFRSAVPPIQLPRCHAPGARGFQGTYRKHQLSDDIYKRLLTFSRSEGETVFVCLLSAFSAVLSRYAEDGAMVIGTSVAGRDSEASEHVVGMFVRTVPLLLRLEPQASFRTILKHVRGVYYESQHHAGISYERLVDSLRRRGWLNSPRLFDVLIEFEQFPESTIPSLQMMESSDLRATVLELHPDTSILPLNIMLSAEAGRLETTFRYDTQTFDQGTIDDLWNRFVAVLDAVLERPDESSAALLTIPVAERLRIRNLGYRPIVFDPSIRIHTMIERFASERPARVCVSCGKDQRTYRQLNGHANQIAKALLHAGVRPGELVAVVMQRSILAIETILAIWKCGAAYLPIDPRYPVPYVRAVLSSSRARVAAIDRSLVSGDLLRHITGACAALPLDPCTVSEDCESDLRLDVSPDATQLAYVIYTSGSTGVPKGAMIEHPGLLNHLHAKISDFHLSEDSVVAHNAPLGFDISVWQMFAAPFVGGRTAIIQQEVVHDPIRMCRRLEEDRISVLEVVPTYLETLLEVWDGAGETARFERLEALVVTGEPVSPRLINRWFEKYPHKSVVNAYGPTEASDDITHHRITGPIQGASVPIGRPIPNTFIYVMDDAQKLCPVGVKGEICVAGVCVGRGYLNAPEQTAHSFTADPFQPGRRLYRTGDIGRWTEGGVLEYFGRSDEQLKVRGCRIELGEIERCLIQCPAVKSAAVIPNEAADGRIEICAYVVLVPRGSVSSCRSFVDRHLPPHLRPDRILPVSRLPRTANGKIDRQALKATPLPPTGNATPPRGPESDTESTLLQIWKDVLRRSDIGVDDRFWDFGGNSLRAMQVLARLRSHLGVDLQLEVLFRQPTISSLASYISNAQPAPAEPAPMPRGAGSFDVAPSQVLLLDIERTVPSRDAFNRNDLYRLGGGPLDSDALERSFARLVERHESLRTTFGMNDGKAVQIVHEIGAMALPFSRHDFSDVPDPMSAADQFCARRIREQFDIAKGPLVRADLMRTGFDDFLLLVSMHQLICDGRSADVLIKDWVTLYEAEVGVGRCGPDALPLQYKDVARRRNELMTPEWRRGHREFWRRELRGASSVIPLRTDVARPTVSALVGERLTLPLPSALSAEVAALASDVGVTEFVVALCAVGLTLCSDAGVGDVTVGTYTRGRGRLDFENGIGFYINTVPLRFREQRGENVRDMLARTQDAVLRAFRHEEYPYGWTMRDLGWDRGVDRSPLFDVMIAMDYAEEPADVSASRLRFEQQDLPRRAKEADLLFAFSRSPQRLELAVIYNSDLFYPSSIQRRAAAVQAALSGMVRGRMVEKILEEGRALCRST